MNGSSPVSGRHWRRMHSLLAAAIVPLIAGCGTTSSEDVGNLEYVVPSEVANATLVWSSGPNIGLDTEYGRLTRAAYEAHLVAMVTGVDRSYLGYQYAAERSLLSFYRENTTWRFPIFGTEFAHILSTDDTSEGFVASFCLQSSDIARLIDDQYVRTVGPGYRTRIEFTDLQSAQQMSIQEETDPTTGDRDSVEEATGTPSDRPGTWSAPLDDLFVGWQVAIGGVLDDPDGVCEAWGQSIAPNAPTEAQEVIGDAPPATLPAHPGWPRGS